MDLKKKNLESMSVGHISVLFCAVLYALAQISFASESELSQREHRLRSRFVGKERRLREQEYRIFQAIKRKSESKKDRLNSKFARDTNDDDGTSRRPNDDLYNIELGVTINVDIDAKQTIECEEWEIINEIIVENGYQSKSGKGSKSSRSGKAGKGEDLISVKKCRETSTSAPNPPRTPRPIAVTDSPLTQTISTPNPTTTIITPNPTDLNTPTRITPSPSSNIVPPTTPIQPTFSPSIIGTTTSPLPMGVSNQPGIMPTDSPAMSRVPSISSQQPTLRQTPLPTFIPNVSPTIVPVSGSPSSTLPDQIPTFSPISGTIPSPPPNSFPTSIPMSVIVPTNPPNPIPTLLPNAVIPTTPPNPIPTSLPLLNPSSTNSPTVSSTQPNFLVTIPPATGTPSPVSQGTTRPTFVDTTPPNGQPSSLVPSIGGTLSSSDSAFPTINGTSNAPSLVAVSTSPTLGGTPSITTISSSTISSASPSIRLTLNPELDINGTSQSPSIAGLIQFSYDFESGVFPEDPWSTGGDGLWTIDNSTVDGGLYSIRSPNLAADNSSVPQISNATLTLSDDFIGGVLKVRVLASVSPPIDIFAIYIDDESQAQLVGLQEFTDVVLGVEPGPHTINFSYQYDIFGVSPLPPSPPERLGAVWIDNVIIETMAQSP